MQCHTGNMTIPTTHEQNMHIETKGAEDNDGDDGMMLTEAEDYKNLGFSLKLTKVIFKHLAVNVEEKPREVQGNNVGYAQR